MGAIFEPFIQSRSSQKPRCFPVWLYHLRKKLAISSECFLNV